MLYKKITLFRLLALTSIAVSTVSACSPAQDALTLPSSAEHPPSPSPASPNTSKPAGRARATWNGNNINLSGASVSCDVDGNVVRIVVLPPDWDPSSDSPYWATLWESDDAIDVLDVGIGYGIPTEPNQEVLAHAWSSNNPRTGNFIATHQGKTYTVTGSFGNIPGTEATVSGELIVDCPTQ
ncbi:lipoprotein LpqH [Arcanobacterium phocae]|uniref:lipoprotein LpqH n=1 Tax=Arcanobacterium phocae TaxID=131112 RepID=UPI001C0F0ADA|nr:lipoprotein LpqH [Arcanobacterium phocae]